MQHAEELDEQIRHLLTELMDALPPSPSVEEFESVTLSPSNDQLPGKPARRAWQRPRLPILAGGVAIALVVALVLAFIVPVGQKRPVAAAAQLRQIATNAATQPVPVLGRNQWLETK